MTGKTRVLHVIGNMGTWGGIETWLLNVLRLSKGTSVTHDLAYLYPGTRTEGDARVEEAGARILPCALESSFPMGPLRFASRLRGILEERGPYDVVHSHCWAGSGYVLRVADKQGIPIRIAHSHSTPDARSGWKTRARRRLLRHWIVKHATHLVACSDLAGRSLYRKVWGRDPRCHTLFYGIDLSRCGAPVDDPKLRGALGLPADAIVLGNVGRAATQKNHEFLLRIAAAAFAREPRGWLLLVGDGPLLASLKAQAASLGIADRVVFAGHRNDVDRILRGAMDVFVMPSLYEGLPVAFIEVQAAGLPSVMSDSITDEVVALPHLVRRIGLDRSPEYWAKEVLDVCRDIERASDAPARMAGSPFDMQCSVAEILKIYAGTA